MPCDFLCSHKVVLGILAVGSLQYFLYWPLVFGGIFQLLSSSKEVTPCTLVRTYHALPCVVHSIKKKWQTIAAAVVRGLMMKFLLKEWPPRSQQNLGITYMKRRAHRKVSSVFILANFLA